MRKSIRFGLIAILLVITIATVGFIFGQKIKRTQKLEVDTNPTTNMRNLVIKTDLQKYGIEVISSTDFNFDSEFLKHVGGRSDLLTLVNSTKPFAFFIKNNSSKEIVGVSLRWEFIDSQGNKTKFPQNEANPGVLMGIKPVDPNMVGKTSLINSKEMKFFTYFNEPVIQQIALANLRFKNPTVNYPYSIDSGNTQSAISNLNFQKEKIFSYYQELSVSVDGIIFNDGIFVGEDQNFFFDSLRGDIEARKDILTALTQARSIGKTNADILDDILSNTANISVNSAGLHTDNTTREQVYDFAYKNYLKNLRSDLLMRRKRISDDYIVQQLQLSRLSGFVTIRKVDDFTK